jgi:hypothetical protein
MNYTMKANDATNQVLTTQLQSFFAWLELQVAQANNALTIPKGYFATHLSRSGPPIFKTADWDCDSYEINGRAGLGKFTVNHAKPRDRRGDEFTPEFWHMQLCEFDVNQGRNSWLDTSAWKAPFEHPLFKAENPDLKRYLFHELTVQGTKIQDRWVHATGQQQTNGVTNAVSLVMPFSGPTLAGDLLAAASHPGFMPMLTVHIFYGHLDRTRPNHTWTHFHGDSTQLPGAVSGFLLVLQGAFKSILYDDLKSWDLSGWNPEKVADRLQAVAARYPLFRRTFETVGDSEQSSVITPPADNRPVEVLFLQGLKSRLPLFTRVDPQQQANRGAQPS